jgi:hypothetical protein
MRRYAQWAAGIAAGLLALYVAGPLWAGWHLRQAMRNRDVAALEARVDFPELRRVLKPRIGAAVRADAESSGVVGGWIKRAVGATVAETAVEALVTPANLSRLLASRAFVLARFPEAMKPQMPADDPEDADDPAPPRRLRWAFFESPTRFRVETAHPRLQDGRIVSILALQGVSWRLVDVDIVKR